VWATGYLFPALPEHVQRTWFPDPNAPGGRRNREPFQYEAYVPDVIADLDPSLTAGAAKVLADADRALAGLDEGMPHVVGIESLARQLLRQEQSRRRASRGWC
jgi:hypothetical protein